MWEKSDGIFPDQLILDIEDLPEKNQESWKFALLAFLHNKGNDDYFKPYSGFASLTYGQGKYDTAKKFAIERNKKGFIYKNYSFCNYKCSNNSTGYIY